MTLEELDSLEHYKIIADEKELKWFYDHCVHPLKRNEAYAFCLSSRHKKLTEEERKGTGLGRSEMLDPTVVFADADGNTTYARWKKGIRAYECHKETFSTKEGLPFPAKTLVCYFHINPCDELKVVSDLKHYINTHEQELIDSAIRDIDRANEIANIAVDMNTLFSSDKEITGTDRDHITKRVKALSVKSKESGTSQSLYKMCKSLSKMKRLQFDNVGTKYWVDIDMDIKKEYRGTDAEAKLMNLWWTYLKQKIGKGTFVMVKTGGGLHTMVDKNVVRFDPDKFLKEFQHFVNTGFEVSETDKYLSAITTPMANPILYKGNKLDKHYNYVDLTKKYVDYYLDVENHQMWSEHLQDDDKLYYTPNHYIDELVYNMNAMIPTPGTYMYGSHVVRVINKDDFN